MVDGLVRNGGLTAIMTSRFLQRVVRPCLPRAPAASRADAPGRTGNRSGSHLAVQRPCAPAFSILPREWHSTTARRPSSPLAPEAGARGGGTAADLTPLLRGLSEQSLNPASAGRR